MAPANDASAVGGRRGLMVNNSLAKEKVPFVTKDGSRNVTWYICGPTVYDSSHIGHARNYVTFDIIRRILEDYFHYDVKYVMNITDVDDKIINRARRNHLMDQYRSAATDLNKVIEDLESAVEEELAKQQKKISDTEEELAKATLSRQKDDLADRVKQEQLKVTKIIEARDLLQGHKEEAKKLGGKEGIDMLLGQNAADNLASQLDAKLGATVTDHAIYKSHTLKYENEFWDDMTALGCGYPDVLVRVTEYMDKIVEYVEVIVANKFAYVANGSVYFDTRAFREAGHRYGKLNPAAVGSSMLASESESNFDTSEKRTSCDFALWKKSKPGEPSWNSPWGPGRPGWHIECSAMASDILGDSIDIHTGGHDLQFPHHDNELAQSEAYFHCHEWVRYFFHSGHLSIDGLKMSKSLKNFITIKAALTMYTARQLRMLFVIQSWDKSINFSTTVVNEALGKEKQFKNFFANVESHLRQHPMEGVQRPGLDEKQLLSRVDQAQIQVRERLEDNFDTAGAISELLSLVRDVHSYIDKCKSASGKPQPSLLKKAAIFVTKILIVFGLSDAKNGEIGFGNTTSQVGSTGSLATVVAPYVNGWVSLRDKVRSAVKSGASQVTHPPLSPQTCAQHFFSMELDTSRTFPSRDSLIAYVKKAGMDAGYAIVIKRSDVSRNRLELGCDRGGQYRKRIVVDDDNRQRNTSTRLIGCPWTLVGVCVGDGQWRMSIKNKEHNHNPSLEMASHPSCSRLSQVTEQYVKQLSSAGVAPRYILAAVQSEHPSTLLTAKTIYNAKAKQRRLRDAAE